MGGQTMQISLFEPAGEVREKCGEVRKTRRTSSSAPSGNGNCGRPHFPFPEVRGSAESSHFHAGRRRPREVEDAPEKDVASQIRDAISERHVLQMELATILDEEDEAATAMHPYQAAFNAAHRALEKAWESEDATAAQRLSLATARMWAGHARHPFKVKVDEIQGWRKRVEHQLRAANAVIERLTKPEKRRRA